MIKLNSLLPVVPVISVASAFLLLAATVVLMTPTTDFDAEKTEDLLYTQGYALWITATGVYLCACFWNLVVVVVIAINVGLKRLSHRHLYFVLLVAGIVGAIYIGDTISRYYDSDLHGRAAQVLTKAIDSVHEARIQFSTGLMLLNVIAGLTITAVMVSPLFLVIPRDKSVVNVEFYQEKNYWIKLSIYSTAFLLVSGVVATYALYNWGALLINPLSEGLDAVVKSSVIYTGATYTVIMAAMYVPIILIYHIRLESFLDHITEEHENDFYGFDKEKWLKHNKLDQGPMAIFMSLFPVVLPLVSSFFSNII